MISAIVLAAGKSTRMGKVNKLLLPFAESTIIGTTVNEIRQSKVEEIIIIENQSTLISEHLPANKQVKIVINKDPDQGLTSSIQCGVKSARQNTTGFLICLGDMPLLKQQDYNLLIDSFLENNSEGIIMPIFEGKRGNPVLFSASFKNDILALKSTGGCKPVVVAHNKAVIEVPFESSNCHLDIDTTEDYKRRL